MKPENDLASEKSYNNREQIENIDATNPLFFHMLFSLSRHALSTDSFQIFSSTKFGKNLSTAYILSHPVQKTKCVSFISVLFELLLSTYTLYLINLIRNINDVGSKGILSPMIMSFSALCTLEILKIFEIRSFFYEKWLLSHIFQVPKLF